MVINTTLRNTRPRALGPERRGCLHKQGTALVYLYTFVRCHADHGIERYSLPLRVCRNVSVVTFLFFDGRDP